MRTVDLSGLVANGKVTPQFNSKFWLPGVVAGQIAQLHRLGYEFSEAFMGYLTASKQLRDVFQSGRIMTAATETGFDDVMTGLNRGLEEPFIVYDGIFALQREILMTLVDKGRTLYRAKDNKGAVGVYNEILSIDSTFLGTLIDRGRMFLQFGYLIEAYEDFRAAVAKLETYKKDPSLFRITYWDDKGRFAEHVVSFPEKLFMINVKLAEVWNIITMLWNERAKTSSEAEYEECVQQMKGAAEKTRDSLLEQRKYAIDLRRDTSEIDENIAKTRGIIRDLEQQLSTLGY